MILKLRVIPIDFRGTDGPYAKVRSPVIAKIAKAGWEGFSLHRKLTNSSGQVGIDQSKT